MDVEPVSRVEALDDTGPADRGAHPFRREAAVWVALAVLWLLLFGVRFFYYTDYVYENEQTTDGMLTRGLRDGLVDSPWCYQYMPYAHGPLVYGLLLLPFFWLGGSKLLWIKLLGAAFAAGGVAIWTVVLRRWCGFAAAVTFFLLCLLPSPFLDRRLHLAVANHMESIFFVGLLAWLFLRQENISLRTWPAAEIGWLAGFASFFCFHNLAMAAAVGVAIGWRWRAHGVARLLWPVGPAFALGFAPHWLSPWAMTVVTPGSLRQAPGFALWARSQLGALAQLPGYAWPGLSPALMALAGVGLAVHLTRPAATAGRPARDVWLSRLALLYAVFFLAAASRAELQFQQEYFKGLRYLTPLFALSLACFSMLVERVPRVAKWLLPAPFLAAGAVFLAASAPHHAAYFRDGWRRLATVRGDDNQAFVYVNLPRWWGQMKRPEDARLAAISRLPPAWQGDGWCAFARALGPENVVYRLVNDRQWAGGRRSLAARCATEAVSWPERDDNLATAAAAIDELAQLDPALAASFMEGYAAALMSRTAVIDRVYFAKTSPATGDRLERIDYAAFSGPLRAFFAHAAEKMPNPAAAFFRGGGRWLGFLINPPAPAAAAIWTQILGCEMDAAATAAFAQGVADGQALYLLTTRTRFTMEPPLTNLPLIRQALADRGVNLRADPNRPDEFIIEEPGP